MYLVGVVEGFSRISVCFRDDRGGMGTECAKDVKSAEEKLREGDREGIKVDAGDAGDFSIDFFV